MPKTGVDLTEEVKGVLPVPNGGTGAGTLAAGAVLLGNGTAAPNTVAAGTPGNVLTDNGSTWVSSAPAGGGSPPFSDASALVSNSSDATKLAKLSAAAITTATTRTLNVPNTDGALDAEQLITLTSAYTLTSTTSAQKLFNSTTNGALTLPVGTYFFETIFLLSSLATGAISFALGGTATLSGVLWYGQTLRASTTLNTGTAATTLSVMMSTSGSATSLQSSPPATSANAWSVLKGKLRVSAAGTLIPQIVMGTAAAAIVGVDSHFRIWNVGSNTVTNVGNWS